MSDPRSSGDPSMDDILASIRKIISEDEARAQLARTQAAEARPAAADQDVLLLTELIEEPKSEATPPASPPATAPGRPPAMPEPPASPPNDSALVAAAVAGAASSAFARLNQAVEESVPVPSASDPGPAVGAGGKTIEQLVKEMLRPMLKEWLDSNLPAIVERYVEREVVRLTRR